jgi:arylsulfatase A-like enzyme
VRILYLDIDSLRPDHLGCYGYHRDTSPNIDRLAREGTRHTNFFVPDAPCLPSRSALMSGRFGIHTGVINHGGHRATPYNEGFDRDFRGKLTTTSWPSLLRQQKMTATMISPFYERHGAWHFCAGFDEIIKPTGEGRNPSGIGGGMETADETYPAVGSWLKQNAAREGWFCHVNVWDPHTPYRSPDKYIEHFKDQPLPGWYTEEVRQRHWAGVGPHSAREVNSFEPSAPWLKGYTKQPSEISSMDEARRMFDGYDGGVRHADEMVGRVLNDLADAGVLDETLIIVSADHGENLGELNIYGDHQTADAITCRVPLVMRGPGTQAGKVDERFMYNVDMAAQVVEQAGGTVPDLWDGRNLPEGRPYLVVSNGAWSCQRGVRFDHDGTPYMLVRSYHDGYHNFPDRMLFDLKNDPHEQHDLASERPAVVNQGLAYLDEWLGDCMRTATHGADPMWEVMGEGGAFHTRGHLPKYLDRLRATDRAGKADELAAKHPRDV